jgi:putative nucleotidyltransferase with HDIG domain
LEQHYSSEGLAMQLEPVKSTTLLYARSHTKTAGIVTRLIRSLIARTTRSGCRNGELCAGQSSHSERVAEYAAHIGHVMELEAEQVKVLHRGGLLHDIGKMATPEAILHKKKILSDDEFAEIKCHPESGVKILEPIEKNADILSVVLQHHERYDGKGYPYGLAGVEISLYGRIVAVADVYDALSSTRPYRDLWKQDRVVDYIIDHSGSHFDPTVIEAFRDIVNELPGPSPPL